ncbi:ABC transporter ATP-binding protein [Haloplasma contractile]|uniref:ABC transporter ATPase component protein n=1 Tax=Haloplasma contractile SSD-17B TaxID=1033810 RepID=U2DXR7_9MOLU|nr:ABC transporter ATP-binding protein [Haloplasma contractile]ERJ13047.1 ABC transporter ATPase component protein [Haloplasma contractile SSD-17B]
MQTIIKLSDVTKSFEALDVLDKINIEIKKNSFVSIIGPSGCGKSTIFKLLTKLNLEYSGDIHIYGHRIQDYEGKVGYMPQKDLLLPWKSIYANVTLPLTIKRDHSVSEDEIDNLIELFGLKGFEKSFPHQLSGGMRQRAALLRTMLMGEEILLLDEPFGAIDSINRLKLQKWLLKVFEKTHKTIMFITHDIDEAILLSNQVYVLSDRPATVVEKLDIEFSQPRDEQLLTTENFNYYKQTILNILNR